jgi:hypothetical protein
MKRVADLYNGASFRDSRDHTYQCAVVWKGNVETDWLKSSLKRNPPLGLPHPQATSLARATNFNRVDIRIRIFRQFARNVSWKQILTLLDIRNRSKYSESLQRNYRSKTKESLPDTAAEWVYRPSSSETTELADMAGQPTNCVFVIRLFHEAESDQSSKGHGAERKEGVRL